MAGAGQAVPPAKQLLRTWQGPGLEGGSCVPSVCWAREGPVSSGLDRGTWVAGNQAGLGGLPARGLSEAWVRRRGSSRDGGTLGPWALTVHEQTPPPSLLVGAARPPSRIRPGRGSGPFLWRWAGGDCPGLPGTAVVPPCCSQPHRNWKPSPAPRSLMPGPPHGSLPEAPPPPERSPERGTSLPAAPATSPCGAESGPVDTQYSLRG